MKHLITCLLLTVSFTSLAQTTVPADTSYWRFGGTSSLTFSQVSLTNWAPGGQNSVAINGNVSLFANKIKGRIKRENSLDLAYGLIKQGEAGFNKSDDLLNFTTRFSYAMTPTTAQWFFTSILDFRTQFYRGVDEEGNFISDFMAPGFLTIGVGVSYDPSEQLSFSYKPITGKFTFVNNDLLSDAGSFGVDPGSKSRTELGSFFRAKYKNEIFETKLELFTGYTESVGYVDVNWQNSLVLQVTKAITTNVFTQLIYDEDIEIGVDDNSDGVIEESEIKDRVQFKSVIGVGLTYRFGVKPEE